MATSSIHSKTLSAPEVKYCVTRKELLAVVTALKHFHNYLYGQQVFLRTDNDAVSWLRRLKDPCGQMARWLQFIDTYNLTITHRPGRLHTNADALSRHPCKVCERHEKRNQELESSTATCTGENQETEDSSAVVCVVTRSQQGPSATGSLHRTVLLDGWTTTDLQHDQVMDSDIAPILVAVETGNKPDWNQLARFSPATKMLYNQWDRLEVHQGILHRRWSSEKGNDTIQLVVPRDKRNEILFYYHNIPTAGHLGANKVLSRLQQNFFWPGMSKDVKK
jgi:hypothetical protein